MIPIALIVLAALVLLVLAFIAPRWSRKPQGKADEGIDKAHGHAEQSGHRSAHLLQKPLEAGRKVTDTSAEAGRKARHSVD